MTLINQNDPQLADLFKNLQGNILKGHGRDHTANIFIRAKSGKKTAVKNWLKGLVAQNVITSTKEQLEETVRFKQTGIGGGMFGTILISAEGFEYLGFDDGGFQKEFRGGMKKADLNDPKSDVWEKGLRPGIHFLLIIGDDDATKVSVAAEKFKTEIKTFGTVTTTEFGEALRNKPQPGERKGAGIEHFGYVDGTSQPLFFEDEIVRYKADNDIIGNNFIYNPSADKSLVLVKDPLSGAENAFGSYFVFRKLEQNVQGFKVNEEKLADDLGLEGEDGERAGAMLVGRFENGTPIELQKTDVMAKSAVRNDFDYQTNDNSKCPFHAHIRKSNPRSANPKEDLAATQSHIMARRGIPFGTRKPGDDPNDGQTENKPTGGVGLLFMSYQASLAHQFEFIQKKWVNNKKFPFDDRGGLDPVIGQDKTTSQSKGKFAVEWGSINSLAEGSFEHFLKMRGGEYFFAPSIPFLRQLG